ncbi:hypothetical protein C4D60_Mb11t22320 [Musa balbisiana]|uniref:Uncharacterized protein n=1 Tax=Musa balbisiana TaxID=52838 RepID=A0A4S8J5Y5_MUSBA|nr:hypothetical protein C4D60_Mb11t22320 [Musa balbisiana]
MSSPSSQFAAPSGAIVGPCFCVPDPIDLTFFIDAASLNCDHLAVTDINGNVVFKVEAHKWSLRNKQVVVDASGKPVISMQQKVHLLISASLPSFCKVQDVDSGRRVMQLSSIHDRWQVFKGNSSDPQHLLFSVKRSSALQFKTELDVFLAANTEEEVCDFKIKGSFRKRSFTVYKGDSSMVIAQMSKEYILVNGLVSKDAFEVEAHKWSLRNKQVVVDASGKPVISMQQKLRSIHDRWQVFKGDSSDPKDLLFSVRRSSALQFKTELDVFLAANTEEEVCDFKMKGSYCKRSCTVHKGDSSTVVAQMSKEYKFVNSSVSKDAFGVAISPNTDHSFIAALLIIQHELHKEHAETSGEIVGGISDGIFQGLAAALGGS